MNNNLNNKSHLARGSYFIDKTSRTISQSIAFNRHRKGSNGVNISSPASARSMASRRRRSTIEHNIHLETFKLTEDQSEKMNDPIFIRKLRNDFTMFGSFSYDAVGKTMGIVLAAQKMRKTAIIFLEKKLGPIGGGNDDKNVV